MQNNSSGANYGWLAIPAASPSFQGHRRREKGRQTYVHARHISHHPGGTAAGEAAAAAVTNAAAATDAADAAAAWQTAPVPPPPPT